MAQIKNHKNYENKNYSIIDSIFSGFRIFCECTTCRGCLLCRRQTETRHGRFFYVVGGATDSATLSNKVWKLDIEIEMWEQLFPTGDNLPSFSNATYDCHNSDMYIFGGMHYTGLSSKLYRYDATANTVTLLNPCTSGPSARKDASIKFCSLHNCLYLLGGTGAGGNDLSDFWKYDLTTNTWSNLICNYAGPVSGASICMYNNNLYVYGGCSKISGNNSTRNDMYRYDVPGNSWIAVSLSGNSDPRGCAAVVYDEAYNFLYNIGGCSYDTAASAFLPLASGSKIDIGTSGISDVTPLDTALSGATGAFFLMPSSYGYGPSNRFIIIYGGVKSDNSLSHQLYIYDIVTHQWNIIVPQYLNIEKQEALKEKINIYPNLATDYINIECPAQTLISIYDMNGRLVKEFISDSDKLTADIRSLEKGIWNVRLHNIIYYKLIKL